MAWVRVDDHITEHPKFQQVGPLGLALYVAGLCYSNRNLTDGFIPWSAAQSIIGWKFLDPAKDDGRAQVWSVSATSGMHGQDVEPEFVIDRLVDAGLWEEADGGYQIHDYEHYQPSKEQVLAKREAIKARVKKFRSSNGHVTALHSGSNGHVTPPPNPNPIPNPMSSSTVLSEPTNYSTTTTLPDKSGATAKPPAAARRMDGPEGEVLRAFDAGHRAFLGLPYMAAFARDIQAIRRPLKVYGLPLMLEFVTAFWQEARKARQNPDDATYAAGRAKAHIPGLVGQIPNLMRRYKFDSRPPEAPNA